MDKNKRKKWNTQTTHSSFQFSVFWDIEWGECENELTDLFVTKTIFSNHFQTFNITEYDCWVYTYLHFVRLYLM